MPGIAVVSTASSSEVFAHVLRSKSFPRFGCMRKTCDFRGHVNFYDNHKNRFGCAWSTGIVNATINASFSTVLINYVTRRNCEWNEGVAKTSIRKILNQCQKKHKFGCVCVWWADEKILGEEELPMAHTSFTLEPCPKTWIIFIQNCHGSGWTFQRDNFSERLIVIFARVRGKPV